MNLPKKKKKKNGGIFDLYDCNRNLTKSNLLIFVFSYLSMKSSICYYSI